MAGSWLSNCIRLLITVARAMYRAIYSVFWYPYMAINFVWFDDYGDEVTGCRWSALGMNCGLIITVLESFFSDGMLLQSPLLKNGMNIFLAMFDSFVVVILIFAMACVQIIPVIFFHLCGPYGLGGEKARFRLPKYPVGRLRRFWTDIVGLCIVLLIRYSFESIIHCVAWILFVMEFQIICKLAHGPRDLVYSDVLVGVIMRLLVIYPKEKDYDAVKAKFVLCMLIIYYMHWSTPLPVGPIFDEIKQGSQTEELLAITIEKNP